MSIARALASGLPDVRASGRYVLYVHPRGHLNDAVVPAGALSCMNALRRPKLGRYAFEVSDDELRGAGVVAVDFHWGVSLPGLDALVAHVRRVHPGVPIVAGGISAGHLAEELAHAGLVDWAVRGDSEEAFAALVDALLDGRPPGAIPNVFGRDGPLAPPRRMSRAAFDATDPLSAEWFPTHARLRRWDARAFPPGPTIPVARGCPLRCPACYGSFADTFGPGWLLRSPASAAALVARASAEGTRNLRLILGKPGEAVVTALAAALAAAGPFRLDGAVGLFLCTPPSNLALDDLARAFAGPVVLSAVAPQEHAPALGPEALAVELSGWRRVGARAAASGGRLRLDLWASTAGVRDALRDALGPEGPSLGVSLSSVWHLTRPGGERRPGLADLRAAMGPLWTFHAAHLLSPALAALLEPFALLDELAEPPEERVARPCGPLDAWSSVVLESWRSHRLPLLPGLSFSAVPIASGGPPRRERRSGATRFLGDLGCRTGAPALCVGRAVPLAATEDHRGVRLRSAAPLRGGGVDGWAIVPHAPGAPALDAAWVDGLSVAGLVAVDGPAAEPGDLALEVTLRMQEAEVALLGPEGQPLRRGRAHLGYLVPPRGATGREP